MRQLLFLLICLFTLPLAAQNIGDTENGQASYYSREYQGAKTAYGIIYDRDELVAAHRQYPPNSVIRVTNLDNAKAVNVRVIDKGPFIRGRVVELSERAAGIIGMIGQESVPVEVSLVALPGDTPAPTTANRAVAPPQPYEEPTTAPAAAPTASSAATASAVNQTVSSQPNREAPVDAAPAQAPTTRREAPSPEPTVRATAEARREVKAQPVSTRTGQTAKSLQPGTYRVTINRATPGKYGVQVGSYSDLKTAMDKIVEMQSRWFDDVMLHYTNNGGVKMYKIIIGSFDTDKSAVRYRDDMKTRYGIDGFTVRIE